MTTAKDARRQLAKDTGDFFVSTTTAAGGAAGATLIDNALKDQDDDRFVTKQAAVFIVGGQTGGPTVDEERAINTKVSDTITPKRPFTIQIISGIEYEVHRIFTAGEKNSAVNVAVDLCFPILFKRATFDLTMVDLQYDYDITAAGFYRNEPRQVHWISTADTELTLPLFNWEVRQSPTLHLGFTPVAGEKLRLFGIKQPVLADIVVPQLYILTAKAAMYLYEQAIATATSDLVGRYQMLLVNAARMFAERVVRFQELGMPVTVTTDVFDQGRIDRHWNVP